MPTHILPAPSSELRWNLRQLYADVFWYGMVAGSTLSFLSVYAARLDATGFQIGLLSAGPALVSLLLTLPAGQWLERHALLRTTFIASIVQRLGFVVLIALPWMFASAGGQVQGIVWITLLMSAPGTLLSIAFNSTLAEVLPEEWRAHAVGRRNALVAVSVTATTLACGQILDKVIFPLNYQIVFAIGAAGALMSSYHLGRLKARAAASQEAAAAAAGNAIISPAAGAQPDETQPPARQGWLSRLNRLWRGFLALLRPNRAAAAQGKGGWLRLDVLRGPFGPFMLAYFGFYTFQYFPQPIFPLFYVNELKLSDGMISLGTAIFHGVMVICSLYLSRASARWGHRKLMVAGALLFAQYPLMLWMGRSAIWYYAACLIGGGVYAFLSGGLINRLMQRVPANDRPAYMALHNLALNLGILAGSMLGPAVGEWIGLRETMLVAVVVRLAAGWMLYRWG
ncbi:MAG TPA: MFS transporter [Anaerolineales bacterium]|nr:MFS transporter [Anaerolineales bacterium]